LDGHFSDYFLERKKACYSKEKKQLLLCVPKIMKTELRNALECAVEEQVAWNDKQRLTLALPLVT
jgi:hypothetical protein